MRYRRARDYNFMTTLAWLFPFMFGVGFIGGLFLFRYLGIF